MKIIWSPLAIERTVEIAKYIAENNSDVAGQWTETIFNKTAILKEFPKCGRIVSESARNDIREIIFKNYRIIYRLENDKISILTVRHGRQLLPDEELK